MAGDEGVGQLSEARLYFQRKDSPVPGLNSCHANKWAIEAAGCTLITAVGVIYTNPFPCTLAGQG